MLILLLLIFVVGPKYIDPPEEYGVAINFASSAPGGAIVQDDKPEEILEDVEEELIEEEQIEEEIAEEKVTEEIVESKEEAIDSEEIAREEAEEAENLKKAEAAKKKAEIEAKEKEAKEAMEKETAAKAAQERAAAKAAEEREQAKATAEAKQKADAEAKAKATAAKNAREGTPFALIENAPIYPGCENLDNDARKQCMSDKITEFISKNFNTDLASDLIGNQKINISFKINTAGKVVGINAKASNPKLEAEAKRVTSLLPRMKPGMQQGTPVEVAYVIPIKINLED